MIAKVLTDRHTFPSRGPHGLDASVKDGLLGLPSGERHMFHRKVIGGFMTDANLKLFSVTVQECVATLIEKWKQQQQQQLSVNANYDLATCTE